MRLIKSIALVKLTSRRKSLTKELKWCQILRSYHSCNSQLLVHFARGNTYRHTKTTENQKMKERKGRVKTDALGCEMKVARKDRLSG